MAQGRIIDMQKKSLRLSIDEDHVAQRMPAVNSPVRISYDFYPVTKAISFRLKVQS